MCRWFFLYEGTKLLVTIFNNNNNSFPSFAYTICKQKQFAEFSSAIENHVHKCFEYEDHFLFC